MGKIKEFKDSGGCWGEFYHRKINSPLLRRRHLNRDLKKVREQVIHASGEREFQREAAAGALALGSALLVCRRNIREVWDKGEGGEEVQLGAGVGANHVGHLPSVKWEEPD